MKTAHGTATGRAPQEEQFSAWLVETGRALREHGLTPGLTAAQADWFRLCFDDPHLKGNTMDDYGGRIGIRDVLGAHSEFGKNRTLRRAWPVRLTAGFAPKRPL